MNKKANYYFISILITYLLVVIAVILYFSILHAHFNIPECPIFKYLKIYCPACGGTRAIISLLKLDILKSIYYNPIVVYTVFFVNLYIINELTDMIIHKKLNIPFKIIVKIGIIILFLNFIIKNVMRIEMVLVITKILM